MKRISLVLLGITAAFASLAQAKWPHGRLQVSEGGHYLQYADGTPFFWLGDTGWDLFEKLSKEEISRYLDNRKAKGFNVIQAVILKDRPNRYGDSTLENGDPRKPSEAYFRLVDWVVREALRRQMVMALLPTWGDKVTGGRNGTPPLFDGKSAYTYGLFLGRRYRDYPNIVWVAGGDHAAFVDSADWRPVWRAMIKGLREGSGGKILVTYHPWGEASSTIYWKDENTLDIHMMQSGHRKQDLPVWDWILRDFSLRPPRPVLDGEPNYEDHPVDWKEHNGYFRAYDVRKQLYRSVFSGGCGVTYGHNSIFQFYAPGSPRLNYADRYWTDALDRPGAFQAGYLKKLILSRPPLHRVPDNALILQGQGASPATHMTAFRDMDSGYLMVYLPVGTPLEVATGSLKGDGIVAWWFNPREGSAREAGRFPAGPKRSFVPPSQGGKNDWVLVLDAADRHYAAPGRGQEGS